MNNKIKITEDFIKKYEKMIYTILNKDKFNLLQHEELEDLVQEGRIIIMESFKPGMYDPERGSPSTYIYMRLDSRLGALNTKKKDIMYPRNMKNKFIFSNKNSNEGDNNFEEILYSKSENCEDIDTKVAVREIFSTLTPNRKIIFNEHFVNEKSPSYIKKQLGNNWTTNRVKMEIKKIKNIFIDNINKNM